MIGDNLKFDDNGVLFLENVQILWEKGEIAPFPTEFSKDFYGRKGLFGKGLIVAELMEFFFIG